MDKRLLLFSLLPLMLFSKPSGPDVVQGDATFAHPTKNVMQIVTGDQAIINWDEFSIDPNETTRFVQPSATSSVLNRVTSSNESVILGSLFANGKVFLINPNGILMGPDAVIDTHGFIASTLDVLDSEFLKGGDLRFRGNSEEKILNLGTIQTKEGDIVLIGRFVENRGKLSAPQGLASIAVGKEILLKPSGNERVFISALSESSSKKGTGIHNQGEIEALKIRLLADGNPYKLAINHTGKADATKVLNQNGDIFLVAENGSVEVHGELFADHGEIRVLGETVSLHEGSLIDASGHFGAGQVFIGGSFRGENRNLINSQKTTMYAGARIKANCYQEGDGGLVVLWSDGSTYFHGHIRSQGGETSGNGGMVEVSGKKFLDIEGGIAKRPAKSGTPGKLLLDPNDVLITDSKTSGVTFFPPRTYMPTDTVSVLSVHELIHLLNMGPVEVTTSSAYGGNGDITIATTMDSSTGLGYATPYDLTLSSHRDLVIQASLQNSGTGGIICNVGRDLRMDGEAGVARLGSQLGTVHINTGRHVLMIGGDKGQAQIGFDNPSMNSHVEMHVGKDLVLQATKNFALIGNTNTSGVAPKVLQGNVTIHHVGGDVLLTTLDQSHAFAQIGHATDQNNSDTSGPATLVGDVFLNHVAGSLHVSGGKGGRNTYALIGHGGRDRSFVDKYSGNIGVKVQGDISILGGSEKDYGKFSGIGFGQEFATPTQHHIQSDFISLEGRNIYLQGGYGSNEAFIGAYTGTRTGKAYVDIGLVEVKTGELLTLQSNAHAESSANSSIGIGGANGPAICGLRIDAGTGIELLGGDLNEGQSNAKIVNHVGVLNGGKKTEIFIRSGDLYLEGGQKNQAFISSHGELDLQVLAGSLEVAAIAPTSIESTGWSKIYAARDIDLSSQGYLASLSNKGPFTVEAGRDILLASNTAIENASGILEVIAGNNIEMNPQALIRNTTNNSVKIVVDNQAQMAPFIGEGALLMAKGSAIYSSGPIQIFTATRDLNEIYGTIGGEFFTPDALYIPQSKEQWLSYYSGSFISSSAPFTIYYKNGVLSPANIERSQLLVSGMLTDFHPADEFLGWFLEFQAAYAAEESAKMGHKVTSSFQVNPDQLYYLRMGQLFNNSFRNTRLITFPKPLNTDKE